MSAGFKCYGAVEGKSRNQLSERVSIAIGGASDQNQGMSIRWRFSCWVGGTLTAVLPALWCSGCAAETPEGRPATTAASPLPGEKPNESPAAQGEVREVVGQLQHLTMEGGFWGIVSGNEKFRLTGKPAGHWQGGETVKATLRLLPDGPSIFMWGRPAELIRIGPAS